MFLLVYLSLKMLFLQISHLNLQTDFAGLNRLQSFRSKVPNKSNDEVNNIASNNNHNTLIRSNSTPSNRILSTADSTAIPIYRSRTTSRNNANSSIYPKSAVINEDDEINFNVENNTNNKLNSKWRMQCAMFSACLARLIFEAKNIDFTILEPVDNKTEPELVLDSNENKMFFNRRILDENKLSPIEFENKLLSVSVFYMMKCFMINETLINRVISTMLNQHLILRDLHQF